MREMICKEINGPMPKVYVNRMRSHFSHKLYIASRRQDEERKTGQGGNAITH